MRSTGQLAAAASAQRANAHLERAGRTVGAEHVSAAVLAAGETITAAVFLVGAALVDEVAPAPAAPPPSTATPTPRRKRPQKSARG